MDQLGFAGGVAGILAGVRLIIRKAALDDLTAENDLPISTAVAVRHDSKLNTCLWAACAHGPPADLYLRRPIGAIFATACIPRPHRSSPCLSRQTRLNVSSFRKRTPTFISSNAPFADAMVHKALWATAALGYDACGWLTVMLPYDGDVPRGSLETTWRAKLSFDRRVLMRR